MPEPSNRLLTFAVLSFVLAIVAIALASLGHHVANTLQTVANAFPG